MPEIARRCEWDTHDQGMSQNGRKAQQNGPATPAIDRKKRKTLTISSHRTVRRKAHHLLGQKIALRYPRAWQHGKVYVAGKVTVRVFDEREKVVMILLMCLGDVEVAEVDPAQNTGVVYARPVMNPLLTIEPHLDKSPPGHSPVLLCCSPESLASPDPTRVPRGRQYLQA